MERCNIRSRSTTRIAGPRPCRRRSYKGEGMKGRPKINRELQAAERRLEELNAGIIAAYETVEEGKRKKAIIEQRIKELRSRP